MPGNPIVPWPIACLHGWSVASLKSVMTRYLIAQFVTLQCIAACRQRLFAIGYLVMRHERARVVLWLQAERRERREEEAGAPRSLIHGAILNIETAKSKPTSCLLRNQAYRQEAISEPSHLASAHANTRVAQPHHGQLYYHFMHSRIIV